MQPLKWWFWCCFTSS